MFFYNRVIPPFFITIQPTNAVFFAFMAFFFIPPILFLFFFALMFFMTNDLFVVLYTIKVEN